MKTGSKYNIDEILTSLDGIKRAEPTAFFYTRLKARMMAGEKAPVKSFVLRPVYAFATLVTILLINAAVVLTKKDNTIENSLASTDTEVQSIASEYNLNDVNNIYDLTLEK